MNRKFTFDTNIFSYYIKGNDKIKNLLEAEILSKNEFIINPITYYEIKRGLIVNDSMKKLVKFNELCNIFGILELSNNVLDDAAYIYADLRKKGKIIEDADILIAATCRVNNLVLITNNTKHFANIKNLEIKNWI